MEKCYFQQNRAASWKRYKTGQMTKFTE